MPIVKDKIALCQVGLSDFSVEYVNGFPFYTRYFEFCKLFSSKVPDVDFELYFAQPQENAVKKTIEWFFKLGDEDPVKLSELQSSNPELYQTCVQQRAALVDSIRNAYNRSNENEQQYLHAALINLDADYVDSITYAYDGHILIGVWGMRTKTGRQIDSVITESVLDHRAYKVSYQVEGEGRLAPFTSINRRYGHILHGERDIPRVIPAEGFIFKAWSPDAPHGKIVKDDVVYTAVCLKPEVVPGGGGDDGDPSMLHVNFNLGENGTTTGQTYYEKHPGDMVGAGEVPTVEPKEGFKFIGWDQNPNDFVVNQDTEFIAQYEAVEKEETPFIVTFNEGEHGTLHGQTRYEKRAGEHVLASEVPTVEPEEGYKFIGWDEQPNDHVVNEDVEFVAQYEEIKESWWSRFWGWGGGCLNWLLALLLLGLISVLLWFLLAHHNFNFCGCNCPEQVVVVPDPEKDTSEIENPEISCGEVTSSGGYGKTIQPVNLGQPSGTFIFDYNTFVAIDEITIYNGKTTQGKPIFHYKGGTEGLVSEKVSYNSPDGYITIVVQGFEPSTIWEFTVNCPEPTSNPEPPVVHEGDDLPKPEKNGGVHFSGWFLSDKDEYPWIDCSKIFEDDEYGEYVGQGLYLDNRKILPNSMQNTFDAVAVGEGTRLIIYSKPNFKGREVLNVKGPMLIENVHAKGQYDKLLTYTFSEDLQKLFPPSQRQWSSSNMHDWAYGSCKILCE